MKKSNYEVEVLVNGHAIQEYFKDGKHYIEARKGNEFSLRIRNNGYQKIVAIPSVDGLSVMNGKSAGKNSEGYIVDGYDSLMIDGWRVSDSEVRKFYFTNPEDSYSQRKDDGKNIGVIGVVVFREKEKIHYYSPTVFPDYHRHLCNGCSKHMYDGSGVFDFQTTTATLSNSSVMDMSSTPTSGENIKVMAMNSVSQDVGAGWGGGKESNVITTSFDREGSPDATFELYYNTREQLERLGVDFDRHPQYVSPQAFPGKYCEPPTR